MSEGLNDDDVGMTCLSSMHRRVMGGVAGEKMSHAAHWVVSQSRKSREVETRNSLRTTMCV
jgi:hypothetical protein